jgi:hypothetical protein
MLAKKSFGGNKRKFSKTADAFRAPRREGPHPVSEKRPPTVVSATEELDRWSPQSHRPSLADQNLSYNSQPSGLALPTKASMFQPLVPFDCWATVLSGRHRNRLAADCHQHIPPLAPRCSQRQPYRRFEVTVGSGFHPSAGFRDGVVHCPAQLTAASSVRKINSNLEENYRSRDNIHCQRETVRARRRRRPSIQDQASTTPNCQFSGVDPCFRDEICWPPQPWAQ